MHFVQLQNFPLYETTFEGKNILTEISNKTYKIRSSVPWLIETLKSATAQNKKIVLNFHMEGGDPQGDNHKNWHMYGGPFYNALEKHGHNVVAIMVGHLHERIGQHGEVKLSHRTIPVLWNGSAIYQHYLLATFEGDSMKIQVVDSSGGENYSLGPATHYDISLPNTGP